MEHRQPTTRAAMKVRVVFMTFVGCVWMVKGWWCTKEEWRYVVCGKVSLELELVDQLSAIEGEKGMCC